MQSTAGVRKCLAMRLVLRPLYYDLTSFLKLLKEEENLILRAREFHKKGQVHENGLKQLLRELCSGDWTNCDFARTRCYIT